MLDRADPAEVRASLAAITLDDPDERLDDVRVELGATAPPELGDREVDALRRLVRALAHHDLVRVRGRDDVRGQRHGVSGKTVRVSGPVEALVVRLNDRHEVRERLDGGQDRCPERRVGLHDHPLLGGERSRLVEDRVGDPDLADVVQERRELHPADLIRGQLHLDGDDAGESGDPGRMAPRVGIPRVDGGGQRLHRGKVELAETSVMLGVLERGGNEVGERLQDRDVLRVVGRRTVGLGRDHADDVATDLQRHVDGRFAAPGLVAVRLAPLLDGVRGGSRDVRLAAQDDLARRAGAERQEEIALAHLAAIDLDEEVEQPTFGVVAGDVERVEVDEGPDRFVGEAGDPLRGVHERRLRRDLIESR